MSRTPAGFGTALPPSGMRLRAWLALLSETRGRIARQDWPAVAKLTIQSAFNEVFYGAEERELGHLIDRQEPRPPTIVIGHWRSGTTHLHYLLAQDRRFAFCNNLQVWNPHTMFFTEGWLRGRLPRIGQKVYGPWLRYIWGSTPVTSQGRGVDNVAVGPQSPADDDVAMQMFKKSVILPHFLSGLSQRYGGYLSLRELEPSEQEAWKVEWVRFLKKMTLRYEGRPLVLKSNQHTTKLRTILELFPKARFIHIHRHPYDVLRSSFAFGQQVGHAAGTDLSYFANVYDYFHQVYLEERVTVPQGQLYEMRYQDLVDSPLEELERAYDTLGLPDFQECRPQMSEYLESIKDYETNPPSPLSQSVRDTLYDKLRPYFELFEYER